MPLTAVVTDYSQAIIEACPEPLLTRSVAACCRHAGLGACLVEAYEADPFVVRRILNRQAFPPTRGECAPALALLPFWHALLGRLRPSGPSHLCAVPGPGCSLLGELPRAAPCLLRIWAAWFACCVLSCAQPRLCRYQSPAVVQSLRPGWREEQGVVPSRRQAWTSHPCGPRG